MHGYCDPDPRSQEELRPVPITIMNNAALIGPGSRGYPPIVPAGGAMWQVERELDGQIFPIAKSASVIGRSSTTAVSWLAFLGASTKPVAIKVVNRRWPAPQLVEGRARKAHRRGSGHASSPLRERCPCICMIIGQSGVPVVETRFFWYTRRNTSSSNLYTPPTLDVQ